MGAVTILYYLNKYRNNHIIKAVILDSPFSDFESLIQHYCQINQSMPNILGKLALMMINVGIKRKAKLDLSKLKPIELVNKINTVPAIFIARQDDTIVPAEQVKTLYTEYLGVKKLKMVKLQHNENLPLSLLKKLKEFCIQFLMRQKGPKMRFQDKKQKKFNGLKQKNMKEFQQRYKKIMMMQQNILSSKATSTGSNMNQRSQGDLITNSVKKTRDTAKKVLEQEQQRGQKVSEYYQQNGQNELELSPQTPDQRFKQRSRTEHSQGRDQLSQQPQSITSYILTLTQQNAATKNQPHKKKLKKKQRTVMKKLDYNHEIPVPRILKKQRSKKELQSQDNATQAQKRSQSINPKISKRFLKNEKKGENGQRSGLHRIGVKRQYSYQDKELQALLKRSKELLSENFNASQYFQIDNQSLQQQFNTHQASDRKTKEQKQSTKIKKALNISNLIYNHGRTSQPHQNTKKLRFFSNQKQANESKKQDTLTTHEQNLRLIKKLKEKQNKQEQDKNKNQFILEKYQKHHYFDFDRQTPEHKNDLKNKNNQKLIFSDVIPQRKSILHDYKQEISYFTSTSTKKPLSSFQRTEDFKKQRLNQPQKRFNQFNLKYGQNTDEYGFQKR